MPSAAAPTGIRFEHHDAPMLGIGQRRPRLSWRVPDADPGHRQRAYEIALGERTFVVESAEQVLVPWPGPPLAARERVEVRVRVRDDEWSPPRGSPATALVDAITRGGFAPHAAELRRLLAPVLEPRAVKG